MHDTNIFCLFFIEFQETSKMCTSRPEYLLKPILADMKNTYF